MVSCSSLRMSNEQTQNTLHVHHFGWVCAGKIWVVAWEWEWDDVCLKLCHAQNWKWVYIDSIISMGNNGIEIIIQPQNYIYTQVFWEPLKRNHKHHSHPHTHTHAHIKITYNVWSNFKCCSNWHWHRDKSLIENGFLCWIERGFLVPSNPLPLHLVELVPLFRASFKFVTTDE